MSIDETHIVNGQLPKTWTCPHCKRRNKMGRYKNEEFMEFGMAFQHCDHCRYVHFWELELTEDFKRRVVDMMLGDVDKLKKEIEEELEKGARDERCDA